MPILAAETSIYPDNLLEEIAHEPSERRWWAVYTKSRQEKSLARQLIGQGVPFYLPLIPRSSLIGGRRVTSHLPLFGSYLFLFATEEERILALNTKRISNLIVAPRTAEMTCDLRNVQTLIDSGTPLTVESRLSPGQRVRVKSGALQGLEGTVLSRRGEDRLLVGVAFLQQGVSILIQDFQVEPI